MEVSFHICNMMGKGLEWIDSVVMVEGLSLSSVYRGSVRHEGLRGVTEND